MKWMRIRKPAKQCSWPCHVYLQWADEVPAAGASGTEVPAPWPTAAHRTWAILPGINNAKPQVLYFFFFYGLHGARRTQKRLKTGLNLILDPSSPRTNFSASCSVRAISLKCDKVVCKFFHFVKYCHFLSLQLPVGVLFCYSAYIL